MAQPLQPQPQPDFPLFLFFIMPHIIKATTPPRRAKIMAEEIISVISIPLLNIKNYFLATFLASGLSIRNTATPTSKRAIAAPTIVQAPSATCGA